MIKVGNYFLDKEQESIVLDNSKHLLVTAGAGSGKTLTILGKISYLINNGIKPNEILCISFTRKASDSLEEKIKKEFNIKVPVYTFHKLALEILKEDKYNIASSNTLDDIIHLFFIETITNSIKHMKLVLRYFDIKSKNVYRDYKKMLESKEIALLEKLLSTFIHLSKCNGNNIKDFNRFLWKIKFTLSYTKYKKEKIFLILALNIYIIYINYLEESNEIDFDDMIINATEYVKDNGYSSDIKYIIIDEYQDTSLIRFNLVNEILKSTNSKLMVVGDDFQSIYHFTGCDLDLFINFKKYFKDAKIMKIENTYRNSSELIDVAGKFVMKNRKQIRKNLKSNKNLSKPIKIIYYSDIKSTFKKLINSIGGEILIIGRNNSDINLVLDDDFKIDGDNIIYLKNNNIKLTYLTIHKSKGLESDNVIMINLIDNYLGFPIKIKNEKILRLVSNNINNYPYSEERRLFYVGLTRTKNYVYLLVPYNDYSIFIKELINYKSKNIEKVCVF